MDILYAIAKIIIIGYVLCYLGQEFYRFRHNLQFIWTVWSRFRIGMFLQTFAMLLVVMICITILIEVPIIKYGWFNFFSQGPGNIIVAPIFEGTLSEITAVRLLPPIFFSVLFFALPFLAYDEERYFRRGYTAWVPMIKQSIKFGLIHLYVGIPIAAALVIILPGFFYACKYRSAYKKSILVGIPEKESVEQAVLHSTAYHTMFNSLLVGYLIYYTAMLV
jgi:hypothetical protein